MSDITELEETDLQPNEHGLSSDKAAEVWLALHTKANKADLSWSSSSERLTAAERKLYDCLTLRLTIESSIVGVIKGEIKDGR